MSDPVHATTCAKWSYSGGERHLRGSTPCDCGAENAAPIFTDADVALLQEDIDDEWDDTEHRRQLISLRDRIASTLRRRAVPSKEAQL